MTTVTVHPAEAPASPAPQVPQPTAPAMPVDWSAKPTAADYDPNVDRVPRPLAQPAYPGGPLPVTQASLVGAASAPPPVVTPTQAAVANGSKFLRVTDSLGRSIGIKKLGPGERMRYMRILGGELSENIIYFGHAMLAAAVVEFEGVAVAASNKFVELEALVGKLDDEGLAAIASAMAEAGWNKPVSNQATMESAKN